MSRARLLFHVINKAFMYLYCLYRRFAPYGFQPLFSGEVHTNQPQSFKFPQCGFGQKTTIKRSFQPQWFVVGCGFVKMIAVL